MYILYSGDSNGTVHLWTLTHKDTQAVNTVHVTSMVGVATDTVGVASDSHTVTCLSMDREAALLAVGYSDGTVKVWDLQVIHVHVIRILIQGTCTSHCASIFIIKMPKNRNNECTCS